MKTVIITGANGNLGKAVTKEFLQKGYRVLATVYAAEMIHDLEPDPELMVQVVDLNSEETTDLFINAAIKQYGQIDAALMLVGGFNMGNIASTKSSAILEQISLNFETAYHITRPLLKHMLDKGSGRLVFIGARPALEPDAGKGLVAYGLSKSLLFTLAAMINAETKGKNVTATVIAPSTLDTPLNRKSMPDVDPSIWVKPEALAEIMEFIVSEKAGPIRESVIKVYNNA
jgi:NAD(P)-dependent dehydrogenase (short-subunit alcohol dehydrogenase family)